MSDKKSISMIDGLTNPEAIGVKPVNIMPLKGLPGEDGWCEGCGYGDCICNELYKNNDITSSEFSFIFDIIVFAEANIDALGGLDEDILQQYFDGKTEKEVTEKIERVKTKVAHRA